MQTEASQMQQLTLRSLLAAGRRTLFGATHGFADVGDYESFRNRVPVRDYEHFYPYIDKIKRGEPDITWPGTIHWMAKSSGTTDAQSKFIPVTTDSLNTAQYRGAQDCLAVYVNEHPDTRIFSGKCLTLGGSKKISTLAEHCQTGDLSAIMIDNAPRWSNFFKTPSKDIALLEKWEEKLTQITQYTAHQRVTSLAGVPSWLLILLQYIMKEKGVQNIQQVWPDLELFIHGGINFEPYREQYERICPLGLNLLETYNASEGFFALQTQGQPGMQLMMDYGIFYEFVPLSDVGNDYPEGAVTIADVKTDVDYAIVITANNGLWRYMIGDTVRFISTNPHRILISGRTKLYINTFGEELMIGNAESAMHQACEATGAVVREYTAAPVYMKQDAHGCHEWLVEFEKMPQDIDAFAKLLDENLQKVNSDYQAKRYKDITLDPLRLTVARQGLFFDFMKANGKLGGQNKIPRLKNDRSLIDSLLKMNTEAGSTLYIETT